MRYRIVTPILAGLALVLLAAPAEAQSGGRSDKAKIDNARKAAPPAIARNATVKDWPAGEGEEFRVLRQGSNEWVCLPDMPQTKGDDPMCVEGEWEGFFQAYMSRSEPQVTRASLAYMLHGSSEGSNTDPYAKAPTSDNQWHKVGPHVMMIVPDQAQLEGIPTEPQGGGPYVMFPGTPYAHIMMPVR